MLVLSRKMDEKIRLYNRATLELIATITTVEVRGNKVKLGFDADNEVMILRDEVDTLKGETDGK